MATTPSSPTVSTSPDPVTRYARKVVDGEIVAGPHVRAACRRHLDDLLVGHTRGLTFNLERMQHALGFFPTVLRLNGGQFEGIPFVLQPAQEFIVGSLFGWVRTDGTRRFRVAYIEMGKGNGKSPMVGGIGLYGMVADQEPRAEIYAAATKKDQAMILFRDAVAMVDQSPALSRRLKKSGRDDKVWNLFDDKTNSFFRPISADDGQSGPRPHVGLVDELHEHKTATVMNMLSAGRKWRRQPLIVAITNSGTDRKSVCWEYREKGIQVCERIADDDTLFAYICALDDERQEELRFDDAVRYMRNFCTCTAKTTLKALSSLVACAAHATENGIDERERNGVERIQTNWFMLKECAASVTTMLTGSSLLNKKQKSESLSANGMNETPSVSSNTSASGLPPGQVIDSKNPKNKSYGSTESTTQASSNWYPSKEDFAQYVDASQSFSALTTIIQTGPIADYSVAIAMLGSGFSETLRRAYNAHSSTCSVRSAKLHGEKLLAQLPKDDPLTDESCWIKANPLLGPIIDPQYLRDEVNAAKGMPSKESSVLRLNFCVWTEAHNPAISYEKWVAAKAEYTLEKFRGFKGTMGLDLSATTDLTAAVLDVKIDGIHWLWPWFFIPSEGLAERSRKDGVPYDVWVKKGFVQTTPGAAIDKDFVVSHLEKTLAEYDITLEKAPYDRHRIDVLTAACARQGVEWPLEPHGQGFVSMGPAWDSFETALVENKMRQPDNPCLNANAANAVVVSDPAGNRKLDKSKATGRIDGMVAATMAVGTVDRADQLSIQPGMEWL